MGRGGLRSRRVPSQVTVCSPVGCRDQQPSTWITKADASSLMYDGRQEQPSIAGRMGAQLDRLDCLTPARCDPAFPPFLGLSRVLSIPKTDHLRHRLIIIVSKTNSYGFGIEGASHCVSRPAPRNKPGDGPRMIRLEKGLATTPRDKVHKGARYLLTLDRHSLHPRQHPALAAEPQTAFQKLGRGSVQERR
jgi:hypothetical protein